MTCSAVLGCSEYLKIKGPDFPLMYIISGSIDFILFTRVLSTEDLVQYPKSRFNTIRMESLSCVICILKRV